MTIVKNSLCAVSEIAAKDNLSVQVKCFYWVLCLLSHSKCTINDFEQFIGTWNMCVARMRHVEFYFFFKETICITVYRAGNWHSNYWCGANSTGVKWPFTLRRAWRRRRWNHSRDCRDRMTMTYGDQPRWERVGNWGLKVSSNFCASNNFLDFRSWEYFSVRLFRMRNYQ